MLIKPNWPLSNRIIAGCTTRNGGFSQGAYTSFNLAMHVGDKPEHVQSNRAHLQKTLNLPHAPCWLTQTHSIQAINLNHYYADANADASFTTTPGHVCVVMTADCLPILLADKNASVVAAIHAGWRGLAHGVITRTLQAIQRPGQELYAWLGPAISAAVFEVGADVRDIFAQNNFDVQAHFKPSSNQQWLADLYGLAKDNLLQCGVRHIYGGEHCTYHESDLFFSFRRDNQTGRMASFIYIQPHDTDSCDN